MRSVLLFFVFLLTLIQGKTQNLITNGSFEFQITCPEGDVTSVTPWGYASYLTPKVFDSCSLNPYFSVPTNGDSSLGFQFARTGHAYSFVNVYSDYLLARSYLLFPLVNPLEYQKKYCLSFYVNLVNYSRYGINGMGAFFSDTTLFCPTTSCLLSYTPQVKNPSENILLDTLGWEEIHGCFTALGNEKYMIIGNFEPDSLVQIDTNRFVTNGDWGTGYYIDDVSLYEDSSNSITEIPKSLYVSISPNPASKTIKITTHENMGPFDLNLFNTLGAQAFSKTDLETGSVIDINGLSDGFYIYLLSTNMGKKLTGKLIISNSHK